MNRHIAFVVAALLAGTMMHAQELPDHFYVSDSPHFPPIINQSGNSCPEASMIGYIYTYEMNLLRGADASLPCNQYPTHFTWICNHDPLSSILHNIGIPSVETYGGRTFSSYFGEGDVTDSDYGWMQGYDRWFQAMHNRGEGSYSLNIDLSQPGGRERLKGWLYNHGGDPTRPGGGLVQVGCAIYLTAGKIPNTQANKAAGVVNQSYVASWGDTYNHVLTICGYDDRIEFDLDGNGVYGEADKDEVGAWLIANSWGTGWMNNGFIWCPYKHSCGVGADEQSWLPATIGQPRDHTPLRTVKVKMEYTHRAELRFSATACNVGIDDPNPQYISFDDYFNNSGPVSPAQAVPMLGRWASGYNHDPFEFGYDFTQLSAPLDHSLPIRYTFTVTPVEGHIGTGRIHSCSIIDYEKDPNGVEFPCEVSQDDAFSFTVTVPGSPLYPPCNLVIDQSTLSWQAPPSSPITLLGYNIYQGPTCIGHVDAPATTFSPDEIGQNTASYRVTALYDLYGHVFESAASNEASLAPSSPDNTVFAFTRASIVIPSVLDTHLPQATFEWWMRPSRFRVNCFRIGDGNDETFVFHSDSQGGIYTGWDYRDEPDRHVMLDEALQTDTWQHIALVVQDSLFIVYLNGEPVGQVVSDEFSGVPAFGDFYFGDQFGYLYGSIDEIRFWQTARTAQQIRDNFRTPISRPTAEPDLITYLRMDTVTVDGETRLRDSAQGHHAIIQNASSREFITDNTFLQPATSIPSLPVVDDPQSSAIYDLFGRRMSHFTGQSGLYIVNGKKVLVR